MIIPFYSGAVNTVYYRFTVVLSSFLNRCRSVGYCRFTPVLGAYLDVYRRLQNCFVLRCSFAVLSLIIDKKKCPAN